MTAKEYLSELEEIKVKIQQLQEERQMYMEMAASISVSVNPVKVQNYSITDRVSLNTIKAANVDSKIDMEMSHLFNRTAQIIEQIRELRNALYIQILYKVYVQGKTLKESSVEMGRSYNYILASHKKALQAFEKNMVEKGYC